MSKILLLFLFICWPLKVIHATPIEVDVELVLAVDVSRSMTPGELEIQRRGYAEALTSDQVMNAVLSGMLGRIAISYLEWSENHNQRIIVPWTIIENRQQATVFANKLTANFQEILRRTSISGAIDFASAMIAKNNIQGLRRIIDISGDGPNNQGRPVLIARAEALAKGIIINGLPLMTREGVGFFRFHLEDLDLYYRFCVIGGPGAFMIPVRNWTHFPAAVRQKLVLELASPGFHRYPVGLIPVQADVNRGMTAKGYDCMIGEKIWQMFIRDRLLDF